MCGGPSCRLISATNACDRFPQVSVTPRPEPNPADRDEHALWLQEYQQWGDVKCACGDGYFCRRHAIWIPGSDVKDGIALPRERQHEGCPSSHYQPTRRTEVVADTEQAANLEDRRQQGKDTRRSSGRHSTSRSQTSSRDEPERPSASSSSRHKRSRSDRPPVSSDNRRNERASDEASARSSGGSSRPPRTSTSGRSRRDSTSRRPAAASDEGYNQYQGRDNPFSPISGANTQSRSSNQPRQRTTYQETPSTYDDSTAFGRYPTMASNTSRTIQPPYQDSASYSQPSPYSQQFAYGQQQAFGQQDPYQTQPAPQSLSYGQQTSIPQGLYRQEPARQQMQYQQQSANQDPSITPRPSNSFQQQPAAQQQPYNQQPVYQRPTRTSRVAPSYQQQSSAQQSTYGQQSTRQQEPVTYEPEVQNEPPLLSSYNPQPPYQTYSYYQSPGRATTRNYSSYDTETRPQENLETRMANVRLDEDSYRPDNYDDGLSSEEEPVEYDSTLRRRRNRGSGGQ
ncbi:uncharacterized protein FMAN_13035 [Fusarium mangiferae]|uniref:Uncharacterized protein n=1 Tax=Fusarium mangiferae TaxID=192010 RepID=A0A1L7U2Q0_FUSMA|nr:uncharacterized protein FMAN_13035 [Fusarium mangiferae]CVL05070.1 uncharacterized protein FMAN_13035 [Fusarium mangiferae]